MRLAVVCASTGALLTLSGCGLIGTAVALVPIKMMFACLPEGTMIDTPTGRATVESIRAGDLVIGYDGDPVKVQQVHGYLEDSKKTDFYRVEFSNGEAVDLCGMHRIGGIRAKSLSKGAVISGGYEVVGITTYRGVERSYDLLTEDTGYQIGGIPVNSMIEEMIAAAKKMPPRGGLHSRYAPVPLN